jgi:GTP-binding protein
MKKLIFKQSKFVKTAVRPEHYPVVKSDDGVPFPEIAVAGRSNVGKSTLLNHLFHRKDLVKTSSVPGKTQAINFFEIDESVLFADLPGYGYAQVPQETRREWGPMMQQYLEKRESLALILFLMDIRRLPSEDDLRFFEWLVKCQKAVILVLTKCDKVRTNERIANTRKILEALNCQNLHHIHYSAAKNEGRKELIAMINRALQDELDGSD